MGENADRASIKINHEVPDGYFSEADAAATNAYLNALDKDPGIMDSIGAPGQCYRPEIVFYCKYSADENGNAYTMQYDENGHFLYQKKYDNGSLRYEAEFSYLEDSYLGTYLSLLIEYFSDNTKRVTRYSEDGEIISSVYYDSNGNVIEN